MNLPKLNCCPVPVLMVLAAVAGASGIHFARNASASDAQKSDQPSLNEKFIGTWILLGKPGEVTEPPKSGGMLKFITGKHWCISQPDASGKVVYHHGGTYTLDGDKYVETIEYANESTFTMLNEKLTFTIKIEGDTYTQTGIGNPYTQVWKRLK